MSESNAVDLYRGSRGSVVSAFSDLQTFETAQRMAQALATSELVPQAYRGKVANCLVALEVAQRCKSSPLMVMANMDMIHGRPSWRATYVIASINACGRFAPLKFRMTGTPGKDDRTCVAWTRDIDGELIEGPAVSIGMAKAEGWYGKSGSKWPTMPELMLQYRAGAFFGRLHASDILMGMRTDDEEREIVDVPSETVGSKNAAESLNEKVRSKKKKPDVVVVETAVEPDPVAETAADPSPPVAQAPELEADHI